MRRRQRLLAVSAAAASASHGRVGVSSGGAPRSSSSCIALAFSSAAPPPRAPRSSPPPPPEIPAVLDVGFPAPLPPSLFDDLNERGIAVVPGYATPDQCALLRFDMLRLRHGGHTASAGTAGDQVTKEDEDGVGEEGDEDEGGDAGAAAATTTTAPDSIRKCEHYWLVDPEGAAREVEREEEEDALAASGTESGTTTPLHQRERYLPAEDRMRRERYVGPRYVGDVVSRLELDLDGMSPYYDDENSQHRNDEAARRTEEHGIHIHETEAAYLYYDEGGYYNWHIDTPSRENVHCPGSIVKTREESERSGKHRRAFSFLLYLGDGGGRPGDEGSDPRRPWTTADGGCLRVYPPIGREEQRVRVDGGPPAAESAADSSRQEEGGSNVVPSASRPIGDPEGLAAMGRYADVLPEEGTFVLFKSEAIVHEVLPTLRERMALVGWIHGSLF